MMMVGASTTIHEHPHADWVAGFDTLHARIAPRFRRAEVRTRARHYLMGLLSPVERKNGWQLAEHLQELGPQGVQRLLNAASWEADAVRDDLRTYVVDQLGDQHAVLIVDETGFVKKGTKSAGVARQYSGTTGRRENQQVGVFLAYASAHGCAFVDRALYLSEEWIGDATRRADAGIPSSVPFATKGRLARDMLARAFAAQVPAKWVVGDTVYGHDDLRRWLDAAERNYVLAVPCTHGVWTQGQQVEVQMLVDQVPADAWARVSAGTGSQGPRWYDWVCFALPYDHAPGRMQWLLVRRSVSDPTERAYYRVAGPVNTPVSEMVEVAGRRWAIEIGFEQAKGEVGLDQYEVRTWTAWYRHITLALLAHAYLEVTRASATAGDGKKAAC
jgi:SRSO17 transposase